MTAKSLLSALLVVSVTAALVAVPGAATGQGKQRPPKTVGTDEEGDWGQNVDGSLAPVGDMLGQDLVEALIGMADKDTVNFILQLTNLPPTGGVPEFSRYNWDFSVDGSAYQLSGAFTEYLRGICNPLHTDSCPPPQDPGPSPFFLRQGSCTVGDECHVLAIIEAAFDPSEATITIPVPLELIEAKRGSKIGPGSSTFGGSIYAAPAAIVTNTGTPHDTMIVDKTFVVPGGKKKAKKKKR